MSTSDVILVETDLKCWDPNSSQWLPRWCTFSRRAVPPLGGSPAPQLASDFALKLYESKAAAQQPFSFCHEVPLQEFAGLEVGVPLQGQINTLSVLTISVTYTFALPSAEVLSVWEQTLQGEIGPERQFQVHVLPTQQKIPSADCILRFYPRFFSLSNGNPPHCLGYWQHNHLRRYGGSSGFSFESGSRSIGGAEVYRLATKQGPQIKELFDCVAHGRRLPPVNKRRSSALQVNSPQSSRLSPLGGLHGQRVWSSISVEPQQMPGAKSLARSLSNQFGPDSSHANPALSLSHIPKPGPQIATPETQDMGYSKINKTNTAEYENTGSGRRAPGGSSGNSDYAEISGKATTNMDTRLPAPLPVAALCPEETKPYDYIAPSDAMRLQNRAHITKADDVTYTQVTAGLDDEEGNNVSVHIGVRPQQPSTAYSAVDIEKTLHLREALEATRQPLPGSY